MFSSVKKQVDGVQKRWVEQSGKGRYLSNHIVRKVRTGFFTRGPLNVNPTESEDPYALCHLLSSGSNRGLIGKLNMLTVLLDQDIDANMALFAGPAACH